MTGDVPEHVQRVRNMSSDEIQEECERIYDLGAVEPKRTLPSSFDNDPED